MAAACFQIAQLQLNEVPLSCTPATSLQGFIKAPGKAVSASQLPHWSVPCAVQVSVNMPGVVAPHLPEGQTRFC